MAAEFYSCTGSYLWQRITKYCLHIFYKWNIIKKQSYRAERERTYTMLKHGILGLLNYYDMTGYEIMEVFRDSLNFFWNAQTSQIYRELQGLEKKGWVGKTVVPQQGKPDKNVFSIMPEGKEELLRWLSEDEFGMISRLPILMKVFFMGERGREENIRYFKRFIEEHETFLEDLMPVPEYIQTYSAYLGDKEKALYWQMTVDYGRRNMQMCIEWAKNCIKRLEETGE